jgi:hypothetical protein
MQSYLKRLEDSAIYIFSGIPQENIVCNPKIKENMSVYTRYHSSVLSILSDIYLRVFYVHTIKFYV